MIKSFPVADIQSRLETSIPGAVVVVTDRAVLLRPDRLVDACRHLKTTPGLQFDFLCHITAVDYVDYIELTYELISLPLKHRATLKARLFDRRDPQVPSVVSVWRGADFQEREIWDLMGVRFVGHPDLRRILLWDGFVGHPLRKDYFYENVPGKYADQD